MKTLRTVHFVVIACFAALGTFAYAQYGVGSVEHPENTEIIASAYEEDQDFKGEWIETAGNALVVSSANDTNSRPQEYPYFYLSRNWDHCVEFTAESPQGKPCSATFHDRLRNAEAFLLKD